MGKLKDTLEDVPAADSEVKLTHVAIGMCNVTGEGWSLIKIKFDPITGTVGPIQKKYTGEIRPYVEEQLRIETSKEDIFNNCERPWGDR